jgi:hypothetical protein
MAEVKFPADGMTYVGWLADPDGDAIGNVHTPELSELAAIVDLSCDITSGGLAPGISQGTIDAASLCSRFVSQSQGRVTVAPALTFWRYKQPDDTAWDLVENGTLGWLLIRTGIPTETPLAVGQEVTLAYVEMGEPMPEFPGGDTNTTFTSNFLLVNGQLFDQKAEIVTVASA